MKKLLVITLFMRLFSPAPLYVPMFLLSILLMSSISHCKSSTTQQDSASDTTSDTIASTVANPKGTMPGISLDATGAVNKEERGDSGGTSASGSTKKYDVPLPEIEEALQQEKPYVFLYFNSPTNPNCVQQKEILQSFVDQHSDKIELVIISPRRRKHRNATIFDYKITTMPAIVVLDSEGKEIKRWVSLQTQKAFEDFLIQPIPKPSKKGSKTL